MHRVIFKPAVIEIERTQIGPGIHRRAPVARPPRYHRTIDGVQAPLTLPLSFDDDTVVIDDPNMIRELREDA